MNKKNIKFFLIITFFVGCLFFAGNFVSAVEVTAEKSGNTATEKTQTPVAKTQGGLNILSSLDFNGIVPCGTDENNVPCTLCHFFIGFQRLFEYGLYIATTLVFVGAFFAGIMHLISFGSEELMTRAKLFLGASLKGFGIVLGAWVIITSIMNIAPIQKGLGIGKTDWYKFTCSTKSSALSGSTLSDSELPQDSEKGELQSLKIQCEKGTVNSITLDTDSSTEKPETYQLKAVAKYANGSREDVTQDVIWSATDETIAKVDAGNVQAINIGNTSITATYSEGTNEEQIASASVFVNMCPLPKPKTSSLNNINFLANAFLLPVAKAEDEEEYDDEAIAGCSVCDKKDTTAKDGTGDGSEDDESGDDETEDEDDEAEDVSDNRCSLIGGKQNAKFIFVLLRRQPGNSPASLNCDNAEYWEEDDLNEFKKTVDRVAVDLTYIPSEDIKHFAVYRIDEIYDGTNDQQIEQIIEEDCPEVNENKFLSYGYVHKGLGRASAELGGNAYYCHASMSEKVLAHEQIGHAFAQFLDEYEEDSFKKYLISKIMSMHSWTNITSDNECEKWRNFTRGCFEGCNYRLKGCFRSTENSIMRDDGGRNAYFYDVHNFVIHGCVENFASCPPKSMRD